MDNNQQWSEWLSERMAERGWRQADLVAVSGGLIKRDRASKWINGRETPSHRLAIVVANTLDVPHAEALAAAGFDTAGTPKAFRVAQSPEAAARAALPHLSDEVLLSELLRRARSRDLSPDDRGDAMSEVGATVTEIRIPEESQLRGAANRDEDFNPDDHTDI